jgi:hypothetical protein
MVVASEKRQQERKNAKEIARPLVSCRAFPENVSTSDCPAGTQSLLTVPKVGNTHTFVFLSASQSLDIRLSPSHETGLVTPVHALDPILRMQVVDAVSPTSRARVALYRIREPVPRVRIPFPPPRSLQCRETSLQFLGNRSNWAVIARDFTQSGPEKVSCSICHAGLAPFFSGGHPSSPVSTTPSGERNAITNP